MSNYEIDVEYVRYNEATIITNHMILWAFYLR